MKKFLIILFLIPFAFLISCGSNANNTTISTAAVHMIDAQTAKSMLDTNSSVILVDVRTQSEYDAGHIKGAILLPLDSIPDDALKVIPDRTAIYLVYCHSGNRAGTATKELVSMGYTKIYDMGGIIDWPYEIVKS